MYPKKLQEAIDDIQIELTSYKNADAVVSKYGWNGFRWFEDTKNKVGKNSFQVSRSQSERMRIFSIKLLHLLLQIWIQNLSENRVLHELADKTRMQIKDVEEKIEKLEWFVEQVNQYFSGQS